jgi:hypothetical protein
VEYVLFMVRSLPSTLKAWIDDFVHLTFLQHIKHDYRLRAAAASHGPDAFRLKDQLRSAYNSSESQRPILSSTSTLYQCIKELYQDIIFMPSYAREFHSIMEMLLIEFHEVCLAVFLDALKESEVGRLLQYVLLFSSGYTRLGWHGTHNTSVLIQNRGGDEDMLPGPSLEAPSKLNDSNKDINWYRGRAGPYGPIPEPSSVGPIRGDDGGRSIRQT